MKFDVLLAKSFDSSNAPPTYAMLLPHLRLVEDAGRAIYELVGSRVLDQIGLNDPTWNSRLRRGLPTACLCHDIGKANDGFQRMVRGEISPKIQPIRHELVSALLLAEEGEVRKWALDCLSENGVYNDAERLLESVIAAVGGHHRKLDEEWKKASVAVNDGGCGQTVETLLTHESMNPLFRGKVTKEIVFDLIPNRGNSLQDKRLYFLLSSKRFASKLEDDRDWWRFAAVLKALTAAADVAGSALPEQTKKIREWIQLNLAEGRFLKSEQMREVVNARLKGNALRDFQKAVGTSKAKVTLVEAGCGTGKTVAAYDWAEKHADSKKLFFCYPTTGTATEGFLGYVAESDVEAKLVHSRSSVDLEEIFQVADEEPDERQIKVSSLEMWYPQVIVCTADTVLSLVRNNRRGWYNSPSILSASFVFDELHAYDNRMFAAVIALIKALPNGHFLLMTASLPKERKEFLLKQLGDIEQIQTPKDLEELPRYEFQKLLDRRLALAVAERTRTEKLRILWICNTVARTQEVFDTLNAANLPVKTYHSRFKYEDRKERHRQAIDGFDKDASIIAVTTQVAEMSLDLDADILISEVAPVPSMIQRLGRLNRRVNLDNKGTPRPAYFIPLSESEFIPSDEGKLRPYRRIEVQNGLNWIDELISLNRPLSQADLAEYFQRLPATDEEKLDMRALRTNWLDSGWFAMPEEVREPNLSVSVILPEDVSACLNNSKEIINKSIPMNYGKQMEGWSELKGNLIAPPDVIEYDRERGAIWL